MQPTRVSPTKSRKARPKRVGRTVTLPPVKVWTSAGTGVVEDTATSDRDRHGPQERPRRFGGGGARGPRQQTVRGDVGKDGLHVLGAHVISPAEPRPRARGG